MSKNRFEQLIEYVINDEEAKAKELFHQIVVEKSRAIYENMMQEEEIEEDNAMGMEPSEIDYDMDESLGGSQSKDMIDDVQSEEAGQVMDDEEELDGEEPVDGEFGNDGDDIGDDEGALEDRVVDLEDKLDELMAEFESMMGGEQDAADMGDMDSDMTDLEVQDDELETEGYMPMAENISLKQVHPKVTTSEEGSPNTKSTVAANSGQAGMAGRPVRMTGDTAQGRTAPTTKDLIGKVGNSPAGSTQQPKAAVKPTTAQASGVNTRTPFPKG